MTLTQPTLFPAAFASGAGTYFGGKNTIPTTSAQPLASLADGFPSTTMLPITSGGVPPSGADFNGILNWITLHNQWLCSGGQYQFSSAQATAIGGYPLGAVVQLASGLGSVVSTVAGNSYNPNGSQPYSNGWAPYSGNSMVVSVLQFGADPTGSVDSTAGFNAALAASTCVHVPAGTYKLSSLNAITGNCELYGDGAATILQFNTTGIGIHVNPVSSYQNLNFTFRDLSFSNVTNVPSAFIQNDYGLNVVVERCFFTGTATYCVVNSTGYGMTLDKCVFCNVTGSGVLLKDNGASPNYSYVTHFIRCDFTQLSVAAIESQGTANGPIILDGCVLENCAYGYRDNTKGGANAYSFNQIFNGCYFESNTTKDVSLIPNGSSVFSSAIFTGCWFNSPSGGIDLGSLAQVQMNSCNANGGTPCVIYGSVNAQAFLYNCSSINQSGTFVFSNNTTPSIAYTPTIGNATVSSATGRYSVLGRCVKVQTTFTLSAAPTGNITVSVPIAPISTTYNLTTVAGVASAVHGGIYLQGNAWFNPVTGVVLIHCTGVGYEWNATNPVAWVSGDVIQVNFEYFI